VSDLTELSSDPELPKVLALFVSDLPDRAAALQTAVACRDPEEIHRLRGSPGGFGFGCITTAAAALEDALTNGAEAHELGLRADALAGLCARAGLQAA
jgi:HPt (histidine-containing phosphotransfer) domain-containing protein